MSAPTPAPLLEHRDVTPDVPGLPVDVLASWPVHLPVAAWGVGPGAQWSRWAVVAPVCEERTIRVDEPLPVEEWFPRPSNAPIRRHPDDPPFRSGWIGWISYDMGEVIEPTASAALPESRRWPLAVFQRCDGAWCYDKLRGRWWATGACVGRVPSVDARGHERPNVAMEAAPQAEGEYRASVARVIEYIRAGDAYQVNLARRMDGVCDGGLLRLFVDLVRGAEPWYGAYICDARGVERRAVLSASPELFLRVDAASRAIVARPMKGTRPAAFADELRASEKDRAELAMIVDLMRNDLGRVCELGSVAVDKPREIESHGSLSQAVATVCGRLSLGRSLGGVVAACFPPGSVTGAPKIRAMQIIAELEGARRGPYCGCIGYVSDDGDAEFSVGIRTLVVSGEAMPSRSDGVRHGQVAYWVGAGIVSDSTPGEEWRETVAKTAALRSAATPDSRPPQRSVRFSSR